MKKKILSSVIISFIVNAVLFIINLVSAYSFNTLPLSLKTLDEGEAIEYAGFGVKLIIGNIPNYEELGWDSVYIVSFDFVSIAVSLVLIFLVVLVVKVIVGKCKENKKG